MTENMPSSTPRFNISPLLNLKMKFTRIFVVLAAAMLLICQACEETNNIGASLVKDQMEIVIDSTFVVNGRSVENHRIQSRTITQVLGKVDAEEYGSFESEFVTQFMSAATVDTTNVPRENIDSLRLIFRIPNGSIVGVFGDGTAQKYVLVVNKDYNKAMTGELKLRAAKKVQLYSHDTDKTAAVSASADTIVLNIPAGDCALYVIG